MKNNQDKIKQINKILINKFGVPNRNSRNPDPLDMLIATVLSQNTNDKNSFRAYQNLKKKFPDWKSASTASRLTIEKEIRIAGLAPQKSKTIKDILVDLIKKTGKVSLTHINKLTDEEAIKELTNYKGVGVKTASCVLLFSLGRNICPVDTHVHRTLNRIGLVKTKSPDKTFFIINKNLPGKLAHSFHTNLIRLGREICKPKNPKCIICPLLNECNFREKNLSDVDRQKENNFMLLDNV
jgi:endonuclease III